MKFLKNWSSWLKGGIIGVCLPILIFLFSEAYSAIFWTPPTDTWFVISPAGIVALIISSPVQLMFNIFLGEDNIFEQNMLVIGSLTLLMFFLIGALIGWIVGKIKKRKKV